MNPVDQVAAYLASGIFPAPNRTQALIGSRFGYCPVRQFYSALEWENGHPPLVDTESPPGWREVRPSRNDGFFGAVKLEPKIKQTMVRGSVIGNLVAQAFPPESREVELEAPDLHACGHVDILWKNTVIEVKSHGGWHPWPKTLTSHKRQAGYYAVLAAHLGYEVHEAGVLYIAAGSLEQEWVALDSDDISFASTRLLALSEALDAHEPPDLYCECEDWQGCPRCASGLYCGRTA